MGDEFVFAVPDDAPPPGALQLAKEALGAARESARKFAADGQGDQSGVLAQYEAALEQLFPLMRTVPDDTALREEVTAALDAMETIKSTPPGMPPPLTPNIRGHTPGEESSRNGRFRFNSPRLRRPSLEKASLQPDSAPAPAPAPLGAGGAPPLAVEHEADDRPWPAGWTTQLDRSGRRFYVDHNTKQTSWEDPRQRPDGSADRDAASPHGEWKLIFRQTAGTHKKTDKWRSVHPGNPEKRNFSILDRMETFRDTQGVFKFKMRWEGCNRDKPQIWSQTSNPLTSNNVVEGYTPIDVPYPLDNERNGDEFRGLAAGHPSALLNGSKRDDRWWWAVGSQDKFFNDTIPGPDGQGAKKTELFVCTLPPPTTAMARLLQLDATAVLREQVHVQTQATFRGQTYVSRGNASLGDMRSALHSLADILDANANKDGAVADYSRGSDPRWVSPEEIEQMQHAPAPPTSGPGEGGNGGGSRRRHDSRASPSPSIQQVPNADGTIVGAKGGYVASAANSGAAGGERVPSHNTRKPQQKLGPAQKPLAEKVPAVPTSDDTREPARAALNAVAGARVNPDSQKRRYDLDGYETAVYIDASRTEVDIVREDKPIPQREEGNAVMYEVASVFAKLHNVGIVGGERVKEMDHYVASVETPVVRILGNGAPALPNRTGGGGRPGENVSDITVLVAKMAADEAKPFPLRSMGGQTFELRVQKSYHPKPPTNDLAGFIVAHSAILYDLLQLVLDQILCLPKTIKLQLVYMTTMRADTAVAGKGVNNRLCFNVMAFQQAGCCEGPSGQPTSKDTLPVRVAPTHYYRVLRYWTQRAAIAADLPPPTGLYDSGVWDRFHAHFDAAVAEGNAEPQIE
eukprot:SAG31_NODE_2108_length_6427_cov_7.816688_2_plen_856_part_00